MALHLGKAPYKHDRLTAELRARIACFPALRKVMAPDVYFNLLAECGIPVLAEEGAADECRIRRRFRVAVFGLEALSVWSSSQGGVLTAGGTARQRSELRELLAEELTLPVRAAMKTAVRAVYSLGFDFGVVELAIGGSGRPAVAGIQFVPPQEERMKELYDEALQQESEAAESSRLAAENRSILLGADPEFLLYRRASSKVALASNYLPKRGKAGSDGVRIGRQLLHALAELRPDPSAEPKELVRTMRRAMLEAASRISDDGLEWLAGGMPIDRFPLGGHIHFSGVELTPELLRTLDNYIALPLALVEHATTARRRPRYGLLGDFRLKSHGGFEYRTLPSWIVSPRMALGVLTLAKLAIDHHESLRLRPLLEPDVRSAFYRSDKKRLLPEAEKLWEDLSRTAGYGARRHELEPLREQMMRMEAWGEGQDIRSAWKVPLSGTR